MLIDVHCHIQSEDFDDDRAEVLHRAERAGVGFVLAMGEDAQDNRRVIGLFQRTTAAQGLAIRILPCLGLHPMRVGECPLDEVIGQVREHAANLAAIGEVGLDYWVAKEANLRAAQQQALTSMAALAHELDLPLSIHSRSAGHHAIDLLATCGARRVCMHAFDGSAKHAVRAYEQAGYLFSIPPSVVRSPQKQKLVARLPLTAMMLESDAPVLGPDRDRRNEPANTTISARAIAEIKGCSLAEVIERTTENAMKLFRLS